MKRTIFLMFFIALLYSAFSSGQIYDASVAETMDYLRRDRLVYNSNEKAYENIDGTPYLEKEFETGKIYLKTGEVIKGDFRFDLYANHIQFINDDSRYVIAYPEKIARVELNGYIFEHIDYKIDAGVEHGYFIVLAEGYYSLYLRKSKTLKDPVSA
ncbi:MAG: hypothetical protein U9N72_08215, partial [Bacteroidota bacterium]|nr:hypothetical protein [Bacteroidota bacterium]